MDYLVVCATAFVVSGLTLFSGFGLGTVLMPAFALFFPVPLAIAATAVVHLANNLFKLVLVGRFANRRAVMRFGIPAALAAVPGAGLLTLVSDLPALAVYRLAGHVREITLVNAVIGTLVVAFALLELSSRFARVALPARYLPLGGLLSGFFGGLSGHQGALRSAFLIKAGLGRDAFIGTGVAATVLVDVVRLGVYGMSFYTADLVTLSADMRGIVAAAIAAAFLGAYLGARLLRKVTMRAVQVVVATMMIVIGVGLASGLIS